MPPVSELKERLGGKFEDIGATFFSMLTNRAELKHILLRQPHRLSGFFPRTPRAATDECVGVAIRGESILLPKMASAAIQCSFEEFRERIGNDWICAGFANGFWSAIANWAKASFGFPICVTVGTESKSIYVQVDCEERSVN